MTHTKWHRFLAGALVTALLLTTFAPAVLAAEQAAPAGQISAQEVKGTITGGQFAKIWLGLAPENLGTITLTAVWDRVNPEDNGVGFYVLNESNLAAVLGGQRLQDNNVASGSTNFFQNAPDNQQGASFRATGSSYTVVVYNDSATDANFTLSVSNGIISDDSGQVTAEGAVAEDEATPEATEAAAEVTPVAAATSPAATSPAATSPAATTVPAGPFRGESVEGELAEQYAQHFLGLEPSQRDGEITLRLTFDPRDNQELARRLSFWVLDDQGFRRYQGGENAGDVAVAAGNRVSAPGEENVRSASFTASGFGPYTVIVYNNSRVPATYELGVTGGLLVDDSLQTITAQESTTGTVVAAAAPVTGTTAASTTTATTESTGRAGEPGGTYTVQSGDTLAIIARDIYGDFRLYEQLCAFNTLANCNVIEVGQVIKLPTTAEIGAEATAPTAAATPAATAAAAATPAATSAVTATPAVTATTAPTAAATAAVTATASATPTSTTSSAARTPTGTGATTAAGTIAEVAASNPNFSILASALEATGLDTTLGGGEYTVFAPTDAAFNELLATTGLSADRLLQAKELAQILQYHVVSGLIESGDITNGQRATTVQGQPVTFEVKDGSVYINGAKVTIADIPASNGVIHAISAVILPPAQ